MLAKWANTSMQSFLNHLKLYHNDKYREISHAQPCARLSKKFTTDRQQTLEQCVEKVNKFISNSKEHWRFPEKMSC